MHNLTKSHVDSNPRLFALPKVLLGNNCNTVSLYTEAIGFANEVSAACEAPGLSVHANGSPSHPKRRKRNVSVPLPGQLL